MARKSFSECTEEEKEVIRERNKSYYDRNKQKFLDYNKQYREDHPGCRQEEYQRVRERTVDGMRHVRQTLLDELGGKCISCGNTDRRVLQFDHIHGGGHKERKDWNSTQIVRYYLRHLDEAKTKLQIMCANCNIIKRWEKGEHGNIRYGYKEWTESETIKPLSIFAS